MAKLDEQHEKLASLLTEFEEVESRILPTLSPKGRKEWEEIIHKRNQFKQNVMNDRDLITNGE